MAAVTSVKKSAKINFYKFVAVQEPRAIRGAGKPVSAKDINQLHIGINNVTNGINNLGATVNSIAKLLQDFSASQAALLKNMKLSAVSFKPVYNTSASGGPKMDLKEGEIPETEQPGFLEAIFNLFKDFVLLAIGIPVMKWLSDEKNREKVKQTVETLLKFFEWISDFVSDRMVGFVDNLYELFRDDKTWFEKIPNIFGALVNFAGLFLAIRWLANPLNIIKDFRSVLGLFTKNLQDSKGKLSRRARGLGALGFIAAGVTGVVMATRAATSEPEMAKGGKLPRRKSGGFISGPQSGYPVSLDGGNSTAFIGHGLEYVAGRASGGFVIPIDTPATKRDSGLMGKRINEALMGGYDLGGMFTPHDEHGFKWGKSDFAEMAAGGKISLTSNGRGNKRMEPGKTYNFRELNPHHSGEGTNRVYNGIPVGHPKDYGVGKMPQFMPSGPNGLIPTPVGGEVLAAGKITGSNYGKSVVVKTNFGNMHYAHLSKIGEGIKAGVRIPAGKIVGVQGGDGDAGPNSYAEHLHLNASKKGHEAFVNFITSGKATTGAAGDSGSGGDGGALALAPGKPAAKRVGNDKPFLKRVTEVARKIKAHPADLLGMMASESGLNPAADNGTHVGLIQFSASSAASVSTTQEKLKKMSRAEQMDYVEKYLYPKLKDVKGRVTAGHLYTAVFLPAFAGKPADFVVASKDGSLPKGYSSDSPKWYKSNKGLDGNSDGKITIADLSGRVEKKKAEFGISGGGGGEDLSIEGDGEYEGDVQGPEPGFPPDDPMKAFQMMGEEIGRLFGAEPKADSNTSSEASTNRGSTSSGAAGSSPSMAPAPGTASSGQQLTPSTSPAASGTNPPGALAPGQRPDKSLTREQFATAKAARAQAAIMGLTGIDKEKFVANAVMTGSVPGANLTPAGPPSSATLVGQTEQTLQSRDTIRQRQTTAIQQVQAAALASSIKTDAMSAEAAKNVQKAQNAVNSQQPTVVSGGSGSERTSLLTLMNSTNNLLASHTPGR